MKRITCNYQRHCLPIIVPKQGKDEKKKYHVFLKHWTNPTAKISLNVYSFSRGNLFGFLSIENPKGVNKICIKEQHEHFRKNIIYEKSIMCIFVCSLCFPQLYQIQDSKQEPKSILIKARQEKEKEKFYLINLKMNNSLYQIA